MTIPALPAQAANSWDRKAWSMRNPIILRAKPGVFASFWIAVPPQRRRPLPRRRCVPPLSRCCRYITTRCLNSLAVSFSRMQDWKPTSLQSRNSNPCAQPEHAADGRSGLKRQALSFEANGPALFELMVLVRFVLIRQVVDGQHSQAVASPLCQKLLVKYSAGEWSPVPRCALVANSAALVAPLDSAVSRSGQAAAGALPLRGTKSSQTCMGVFLSSGFLLLPVPCLERKGRSSSRRLRSGSQSARKGVKGPKC